MARRRSRGNRKKVIHKRGCTIVIIPKRRKSYRRW